MDFKRTGKIKKVDTSSKIFEWKNKLATRKGFPTNSVRFIRLSGYYPSTPAVGKPCFIFSKT